MKRRAERPVKTAMKGIKKLYLYYHISIRRLPEGPSDEKRDQALPRNTTDARVKDPINVD